MSPARVPKPRPRAPSPALGLPRGLGPLPGPPLRRVPCLQPEGTRSPLSARRGPALPALLPAPGASCFLPAGRVALPLPRTVPAAPASHGSVTRSLSHAALSLSLPRPMLIGLETDGSPGGPWHSWLCPCEVCVLVCTGCTGESPTLCPGWVRGTCQPLPCRSPCRATAPAVPQP